MSLINKMIIGKLKSYGESVMKEHGESDVNLISSIAESQINNMTPVKRGIAKYFHRIFYKGALDYIGSLKNQQEKTVIDVNFKVKGKKNG